VARWIRNTWRFAHCPGGVWQRDVPDLCTPALRAISPRHRKGRGTAGPGCRWWAVPAPSRPGPAALHQVDFEPMGAVVPGRCAKSCLAMASSASCRLANARSVTWRWPLASIRVAHLTRQLGTRHPGLQRLLSQRWRCQRQGQPKQPAKRFRTGTLRNPPPSSTFMPITAMASTAGFLRSPKPRPGRPHAPRCPPPDFGRDRCRIFRINRLSVRRPCSSRTARPP